MIFSCWYSCLNLGVWAVFFSLHARFCNIFFLVWLSYLVIHSVSQTAHMCKCSTREEIKWERERERVCMLWLVVWNRFHGPIIYHTYAGNIWSLILLWNRSLFSLTRVSSTSPFGQIFNLADHFLKQPSLSVYILYCNLLITDIPLADILWTYHLRVNICDGIDLYV